MLIKKTIDDSVFEEIDVSSSRVTGTGTNVITVNPTNDFASTTQFYLQIDATAFDDESGNSFAGISDKTSLNFTSADIESPALSSSAPADDAVNIAVNSDIELTFSESVDVENGKIYIKKVSDDSLFEEIDVTSSQVTGAGTNYSVGQTLNIPGSDLGGDTANNATITVTSVGANGEITGATVAGTPTDTDATYSNLSEPSSFSPNPSADGTPGLNFLSHTDPRILPALKTVLETLTNAVGYTLDITSAYRSPDYNASVGGSKKSMHMQGKAVDVIMTGKSDSERQQFIQAAIDAGIKGVGVYNTFTHIDIRDNKAAWGSNGSRTSLPNFPWAQQVLGANGYATS